MMDLRREMRKVKGWDCGKCLAHFHFNPKNTENENTEEQNSVLQHIGEQNKKQETFCKNNIVAWDQPSLLQAGHWIFICSAVQLPDEVDWSTGKGFTSGRPSPLQRAWANVAVQLGEPWNEGGKR